MRSLGPLLPAHPIHDEAFAVDRVGNDLNDDDNAYRKNRKGQDERKEPVQDSHIVLLSDAGRGRDSCCQVSDGDIQLGDGQASQFLNAFSNVLTDLRRGVWNGRWPTNAQFDGKKRRIAVDLGFCLRQRL
jgi:hypothetical protein